MVGAQKTLGRLFEFRSINSVTFIGFILQELSTFDRLIKCFQSLLRQEYFKICITLVPKRWVINSANEVMFSPGFVCPYVC